MMRWRVPPKRITSSGVSHAVSSFRLLQVKSKMRQGLRPTYGMMDTGYSHIFVGRGGQPGGKRWCGSLGPALISLGGKIHLFTGGGVRSIVQFYAELFLQNAMG